MFFLIRMTFWMGLVLVLLPTGQTTDDNKLPKVSTGDAVSAAAAAVSDMSQFCTRQPTACEVGDKAATVIGHRAQAGARKIYQMITDKKNPDQTGSIERATAGSVSRDTLTPADRDIVWHAPQKSAGVPTLGAEAKS
jgi:DNA-binding transcriptional regulator YdaS (Cro superfamily)